MIPQAVLCVLAAVTTATAFDGRIIGGELADIADFPYQLGVFRGTTFLCGGVLIGPEKAITIATCIDDFGEVNLRVQAGSTFRNNFDGGEWIDVTSVSIPNNFFTTITRIDYNIAVLQLSFASVLGVPIPLTDPSDPMPIGANGTITGYGTVTIGVATMRLHKGVVQRIDDATCNDLLFGAITSRMLCCQADGVDACLGDGGGPLVYDGKVVGIVSWGSECANTPGVYTSIFNSYIYTFINSH